MKKENISNACKNAFSVVEILVSLIVLSALSAVFAPMITKRLNVKSVNVKLPKMVVSTDCKFLFEDCMLCNKNTCLVRQKSQNDNLCPDGSIFVSKDMTGGTEDLCVMKVNAQQMPGYEQSFYLNQVNVGTNCASGSNKCSWSGTTAGSSTANDGLSSTYSGANRPVNNYPAAQEICAYFATPTTRQKDWRLPTQAELTGIKNNISNLSVGKGYSGLQLCDASSSSGSAKCAITTTCTGATSNTCSPSSIWGQGNTYLNLSGGAASVATGNASSAYSTRCVIPYSKVNPTRIPYYECQEYRNPSPPAPVRRCYDLIKEKPYYLGKDFDSMEHFCTDTITNSSYTMYKCGFVNGTDTTWTDDEYDTYIEHNTAYLMSKNANALDDCTIEGNCSSPDLEYCYTSVSSSTISVTSCDAYDCTPEPKLTYYECFNLATPSDTVRCNEISPTNCGAGEEEGVMYYCDNTELCFDTVAHSANFYECAYTDNGVDKINDTICPTGASPYRQPYTVYKVCTRGGSCYTNTNSRWCSKYASRGWRCSGTRCTCTNDWGGRWVVNWLGGTSVYKRGGAYYCNRGGPFTRCDAPQNPGTTYFTCDRGSTQYSSCPEVNVCTGYYCGSNTTPCLQNVATVSTGGYTCSDGTRYRYCAYSACTDYCTKIRSGRAYYNRSTCTNHSSDRKSWRCSGRACWCGSWKVNWFGGTSENLRRGWYCNNTERVSLPRFRTPRHTYKRSYTCAEGSEQYACGEDTTRTYSSCSKRGSLNSQSSDPKFKCNNGTGNAHTGEVFDDCNEITFDDSDTIYRCDDGNGNMFDTISPTGNCETIEETIYQCEGRGDTYEVYDTIAKKSYQCDTVIGADVIQSVPHPLYYCGADTTIAYESYETKTGYLCGSDTTVYVKCTKK